MDEAGQSWSVLIPKCCQRCDTRVGGVVIPHRDRVDGVDDVHIHDSFPQFDDVKQKSGGDHDGDRNPWSVKSEQRSGGDAYPSGLREAHSQRCCRDHCGGHTPCQSVLRLLSVCWLGIGLVGYWSFNFQLARLALETVDIAEQISAVLLLAGYRHAFCLEHREQEGRGVR